MPRVLLLLGFFFPLPDPVPPIANVNSPSSSSERMAPLTPPRFSSMVRTTDDSLTQSPLLNSWPGDCYFFTKNEGPFGDAFTLSRGRTAHRGISIAAKLNPGTSGVKPTLDLCLAYIRAPFSKMFDPLFLFVSSRSDAVKWSRHIESLSPHPASATKFL